MTRLTKSIRENMATALVRHKMKDEGERLRRESIDLFKLCHAHVYDKKTLDALTTVAIKFPNFVDMAGSIYVTAMGMRVPVGEQHIGGRFASAKVELAKSDYLLTIDRYSSDHNITDPVLAERVQSFALAMRAFSEAAGTSYSEALSALNAFTTGKALAKGWPDAMPVIGSLIPETEGTSLPVVQIDTLNKTFGLPPETGA